MAEDPAGGRDTPDAAAVQRVGMARRVAGAYLLVAALWIVGSGALVFQISVRTPLSLAYLETIKGLVFVGVTGIGLWVVLSRWERRMADAMRAEQDAGTELRRAEQMRADFLNGVSHELRTPLTALVGYAETIEHRGAALTAIEREEIARRMTVNAERLQRLVLDMIDVGRVAEGLGRLEAGPVDLRALVDAVVGATSDPRCLVEPGPGPVLADVDLRRIERVVEHLLDNALRHGIGATRIVARVWGDDESVHLSVEDDGPGLPDELVQRAFDPFVQGERAVHGASPGVGLGLALVAEFARLHGGDVTCENGSERGVRFTVSLPRTLHARVARRVVAA
ncbi:MAG: HAMP domain-containing sensor histidine kinase [Nitriliruptoraceae bacterium]